MDFLLIKQQAVRIWLVVFRSVFWRIVENARCKKLSPYKSNYLLRMCFKKDLASLNSYTGFSCVALKTRLTKAGLYSPSESRPAWPITNERRSPTSFSNSRVFLSNVFMVIV